MNCADLDRLIDSIECMNLDELRSLWGRRYGPPPPLRSVPIMRMVLAWRIQSEALGELDASTRRMLARSGAPDPEGKHLGIGARLTRHWQGRQIEVVVEERGFRWDDRLFPSLSAVATAIAGSRWNGPRFFGLRGTP
jgi:hypothetical protein